MMFQIPSVSVDIAGYKTPISRDFSPFQTPESSAPCAIELKVSHLYPRTNYVHSLEISSQNPTTRPRAHGQRSTWMDATKRISKDRIRYGKTNAKKNRAEYNATMTVPDIENIELCRSMLAQFDAEQVSWAKVAEEQNLQEAQTAYAKWTEAPANLSLGFYYSVAKQLDTQRIDWKIIGEQCRLIPKTAKMRWVRLEDRFEGKTKTNARRTAPAKRKSYQSADEDAEESQTSDSDEDMEMTDPTHPREDQELEEPDLQDPSLLLQVLQELKELRQETKETKKEFEETKKELERSREESRNLRELVTELKETLSTQGSRPSLSYAGAASRSPRPTPSIAVTPPDSQPSLLSITDPKPSTPRSQRSRTTQSIRHETGGVVLDLSETELMGQPASQLVDHMNRALASHADTKDIKCCGTKHGKPDRTTFMFQNDIAARKVHDTEPWKTQPESKLDKARKIARRIYKIKLLGAREEWFDQDSPRRETKPDSLRRINTESATNIREIRQMGRPRHGDVRAVAECASLEEQTSLLRKGHLMIDGYYVDVVVFHELPTPRQCLNCWSFDHNRADCSEDRRCKYCGEPGHDMKDCIAEAPKCANCQKQHIATAKECEYRRTATKPTHAFNVY